MPLLLILVLLLFFADWLYLLYRLSRHEPLVPVYYPMILVPLVSNFYLRIYLYVDQATPGTASSEVKALLKRDAEHRAFRANVETATIY